MRKILLFVLASVSFMSQASATIWNVEAGGGSGIGTPYFDPSILTIQQGDIVNWNWVSGMHNVAATSGPESFNSGSHSAPYEWSFTFNIPGTYEYECSLFSHADTQYGTITVAPLAVVELTGVDDLVNVYPNPATDQFFVEFEGVGYATVSLTSTDGRTVQSSVNAFNQKINVSVNDFPAGIYFVRIESEGIIRQTRLVVSK